jgi:hypothetical protein
VLQGVGLAGSVQSAVVLNGSSGTSPDTISGILIVGNMLEQISWNDSANTASCVRPGLMSDHDEKRYVLCKMLGVVRIRLIRMV